MTEMRNRLKERCPELYEALERSWAIAQNEWLPAVKMESGSYNSYPHVRNLERYLDHVILEFEKVGAKPDMSHIEIYVICSAILFHDMGRIKGAEGHGSNTKKMLMKGGYYGTLGIPSKQLAEIIADVCEAHEPKHRTSLHLSTTSINPYGKVRKQELASLLILVDKMDSAFTRVIPHYLMSVEQQGLKAEFRSIIKDVYANPKSQTLCTVLGDMEHAKYGDKLLTCQLEVINGKTKKGKSDITGYDICNKVDEIEISYKAPEKPEIVEDVLGKSAWLSDPEKLIAGGYLKINSEWHLKTTTLLAVILSDLRNNVSALEEIREDLVRLGIRIRKWRLEYEQHLYDESGMETYEGIFFPEYLVNVTERMWDLSTQIFGNSDLTYENLTAIVPEGDIEKIKIAVRRLSLMAKRMKKGKKAWIWVGQERWKWFMKRVIDRKGNERCEYLSPRKLINKLNELSKTE